MNKLNDDDRYSVSFLNVPFSEIDKAKSKGALWDNVYRKWYIPTHLNPNDFEQWLGITPDFNFSKSLLNNPRLYIDLVPRTSWAHNLCNQLAKSDWDKIRKKVYEKSNFVCEICGGTGPKNRLDAHERWHYDDSSKTQTLVKISSLCPNCHMSTHMGFAKVLGKEHIAMAHLAWINLWTSEESHIHLAHSFNQWQMRSKFEWETDISLLFDDNNVLSANTLKILKQDKDKWFIDKTKIKK